MLRKLIVNGLAVVVVVLLADGAAAATAAAPAGAPNHAVESRY